MNEENLRLIDIEDKSTANIVTQGNGLVELPVQKKENVEMPTNKINSQKIINKLPSWSIEPPLEIKRGQR